MPKKNEKKKNAEEIVDNDTSTTISCSEMSVSCSIDRELDGYDLEARSFRPASSSKSKSTRSKCLSDIAESLSIRDYSQSQHTFCNGCGKFSISGVTCDNTKAIKNVPKSPVKSIAKLPTICDPCKIQKSCEKRVCPECFEDLSVIPSCADCPNCTRREQLQRKIKSFKKEDKKEDEREKIRSCIRSIVEEIFLETKERLTEDWQRLNKKPKKKANKMKKKERKISQESSKLLQIRPRCKKLQKTTFELGKRTPGVIIGHEMCQSDNFLVPKNMGWLWNIGIYGMPHFRRGWKPGAVKTTVAKIMKKHLTPPAEPVPIEDPADPPTLSVKKKEGEYLIVMNPFNPDDDTPKPPIVFKIQKSEEGIKRSKAKQILKSLGIEKACDCPSLDSCNCHGDCEKNRITKEISNVSQMLCLNSDLKFDDLKETSESEMDVEFTPPSAMKSKNPCKTKPKKFSYAATQYETQDNLSLNEITAKEKPQKGRDTLKSREKSKETLVTTSKKGTTLKGKEKSKETLENTKKIGTAIKEEKDGKKKGKPRSVTDKKEEKSQQQSRRIQRSTLRLRDFTPRCCYQCAPICETICRPSTPSFRRTPSRRINPYSSKGLKIQIPSHGRYVPVYY